MDDAQLFCVPRRGCMQDGNGGTFMSHWVSRLASLERDNTISGKDRLCSVALR